MCIARNLDPFIHHEPLRAQCSAILSTSWISRKNHAKRGLLEESIL